MFSNIYTLPCRALEAESQTRIPVMRTESGQVPALPAEAYGK